MRSPPIEKAVRYLEAVREQSGLTLSAIARKAGMDPSTLTQPIKRYEEGDKLGGTRKISLVTLRRVAGAMNVPLPDDMDPNPPRKAEGDLELAILLAERIPAGRVISSAEKTDLIREILTLLRQR